MLDLLIIQHEKDTPPGTALIWASKKNLKTHVWNISTEPCPFSPEQINALLVCGGSMNTFQEDLHPWLKDEKVYLKKCISLHKPIFGLCLGSQLLAEVLGGKSYPYNKWEIGFIPVQLLASSSSSILPVFHWHQCTFDLPPGAKLLATNDFCKNQAFTFADNIVATQFHPEATESWITECAQTVNKEKYHGLVQSKEEMLRCLPLQKPLQKWFFSQLDSWYR